MIDTCCALSVLAEHVQVAPHPIFFIRDLHAVFISQFVRYEVDID